MYMGLAIAVEGGAISPSRSYRCLPHKSMSGDDHDIVGSGITTEFFWLAHSHASHETEEFRTKEAAKLWLTMITHVAESRRYREGVHNLQGEAE